MFNRKTLFIIGAGAGVDLNLPVGTNLALDIQRRTKVSLSRFGTLEHGTFDEELALSFFGPGKGRNYGAAFDLIHRGILLANSIDDFLNIHEGAPEVVEVGKAAIIRSILAAERHSHLYVNPSNVNNTLDLMRVHTSWMVKFMRVLGPGRKAPDVERALDDVVFINFNYDRCLEHFLTHALHLQYGISKQQAAEIVTRATIIHPYGWVGALDRVPFGGSEHSRLDYLALSRGIKTYTEQVEEESTLLRIEEVIRSAKCLVFLGFAYHTQNMNLLFGKHDVPEETKPIFGTALGMSKADTSVVTSLLEELFPEYDPDDYEPDPGPFGISFPRSRLPRPKFNQHINIENELNCAQLFDHYAKSLAG
ncbi:hypothetical protein [Bradyrhizobium pachyrhizi]|uniref:hypothetical protein n=1 Tax=Bradyrhizobium pachyrhizi TaxID=280333 RepID=UPI00067BB3F1|nr:hypothetical protein [Bradyrhizobium pachyrhizi]